MAETTISPVHMELIIDQIRQGRCVPFVGAGANVSSKKRGYEGLSLGAEVAKILAAKLKLHPSQEHELEGLDLAQIAQALEVLTDRQYLIHSAKTILDDRQVDPSPLLITLAKLPFSLIVSTNYDRLLEKALDEVQRPYKVIAPPFDPRELIEELAQYDGLTIFKMHGTFVDVPGTEKESSIIITEDDYIDFLNVVRNEREGGIPNLILAKFVTDTLLLLGYSAKDWDFRLIYRTLPRHPQRKVFAILKEDPSSFWVRYLEQQRFVVYNIDIYEFAEQLDQSYEKYGA